MGTPLLLDLLDLRLERCGVPHGALARRGEEGEPAIHAVVRLT